MEVSGITKISTVNGFVVVKGSSLPSQRKVTLRYTEDSYGKTLSMSDELSVMISVAFEDIEKLVNKNKVGNTGGIPEKSKIDKVELPDKQF